MNRTIIDILEISLKQYYALVERANLGGAIASMLIQMMEMLKNASRSHARQIANVSPKVKWSDDVRTHNYEIDAVIRSATSRPIRRIVSNSKKRFRNVIEAVNINRRRVRDETLQQYYNILPRLRRFGFNNLSVADMESKQMEIIDELDTLRCVDPNTGNVFTSETYMQLEEKLHLLLEASDCFAQKANTEHISCTYDDNVESNRACLIFSIKSKHATKQRTDSFDLYLKSRNTRMQSSAMGSDGQIAYT